MELLSPWFLAGGLGVALPLWLHLMNRATPVRMPFSSLMFFRKRTETTVRERRLRYLLLLAARIALLLLLALAFAKPVWQRPPAVISGDVPRLHVVALDTSLSMQHGDRWERALGEANSIVESLGSGDRAQILVNGPSVRVLTAATADQAELRRALSGLRPTDARNQFGDVIEAVRSLVAGQPLPVELHLISDLQQSALPTRFQDLVLPDSAELRVHDVSAGEFSNWTVESVKGATRLYGEARPTVEATVASFAAESASKTVSLDVDGVVVGSLRKEVPPRGRVTFAFVIPNPPRGFSRAEFRLQPTDELPADDVRRIALDNTDPDPLLFVAQDGRQRDLLYYRAALEASAAAQYRLESVSAVEADRMDPGRFTLVVLSDVPRLPPRFETRLRAWVQSGGSLLITLGPNSALARRVALTGHDVEPPLASGRSGEAYQVAGEMDGSHPVASAAEGLRPVKFFLYGRLRPLEGDTMPLRLGNGDPLLVEHEIGSGRTLVFASSFDNVWNDLPVTPVFVPFVAEAARYLTGADSARGEALLGSVLELGRRRGANSSVQVVDPSGERVLSLSDSVNREAVPLESLGFYEVRGGTQAELLGVNPDARESNLRQIEAETLELWKSTGRAAPGGDSEEGMPPPEVPPWRVWRLVLAILLVTVLLESLVGNRHLDAARGD